MTKTIILLCAIFLLSCSSYAQDNLKIIESSFDGKIGVYAIDTNTNQAIGYRENDRFPVQSTFKLLAVSALLKQSVSNKNLLQEKIDYTKNDLVFWHPITEKYVNSGMTLEALSAAAISYSDNPAINLIMKKFGGIKFVTDFAESIGNKSFHLSHYEPNLNSNPSLNEDISTPKDMGLSVQKILLSDLLPQTERTKLVTWMRYNTTGDKRIRAGVPLGWSVADKTGSGEYGIANDIGIVWSTTCKPIVLSIYAVQNSPKAKAREDVVAATTKIVLDFFSKNDPCFKAF